MEFRKAERRRARARIAIEGPSGSGKTHSSLLLASGLADKIALVDTEHSSSEIEAGKPGIPEFQVLQMEDPFTPERYIQAIDLAEKAGIECLIIDSLSHEWNGAGGILDDHARMVKMGKNSFAAWKDLTPRHDSLIQRILGSSMHIIATMRAKTEHVLSSDDKGKQVVKKMGMAAVQRDTTEYEFSCVLKLDRDTHYAVASKDRTIFEGREFVITKEIGAELREWLESGAAPSEPVAKPDPDNRPMTDEEMKRFSDVVIKHGFKTLDECLEKFQINRNALTRKTALSIVNELRRKDK